MQTPRFATSNSQRGQALIFGMVILVVFIAFGAVLISAIFSNSSFINRTTNNELALQVAETGIERVLWCLNNPSDCDPSYSGETQTVGDGSFTATVPTIGDPRVVTSVGTVRGEQRTIEVTVANLSSLDASFYYGLQAGVGGILMENNNVITGNVYSNGSVVGDNNSEVTGDVILAVGNSATNAEANPEPYTTSTFGQNTTQYVVQSFVPTVTDRVYEIDLKIARTSAAPSDFTVSLYSDAGNNPGALLSGASVTVNASTPPVSTPGTWESGWTEVSFTPQTQLTSGTRYWIVLRLASNNALRYYTVLHADADDTFYANGTAKYGASATSGLASVCASACDIAFRVKMGGSFPLLRVSDGVGGNAFANTIESTDVGKHACYQNLIGSVEADGGSETCTTTSTGTVPCVTENTQEGVGPFCHPNNPDAPPAAFPLTSAQIVQMEAQAAAGGTVNCSTPCSVNSGVIGPKKYLGDVTLGGTVTLNGTVWVEGNLTVDGTINLSTGYGTSSGVIIADKPSNPVNSGHVIITNNCAVNGNGTDGTYVMLLSASTSMNDASPAIDVNNSLTAGVAYAANGVLVMKNNANLKEVTGQKIVMKNNATITYESGLASALFSGGPGGAWKRVIGTWEEIK